MSWSIPLFRIWGIAVKVHVTFLMLLLWLGAAYYWSGGWNAAVEGTGFTLAIFGCVLLHELGHALAARRYGIPTPDITLLPIGGVARLQRMPDKPEQEIVVALAGPLVNVAIAVLLTAHLGGVGSLANIADFAEPEARLLPKLAVVNVWLVVFNMLPAFPMDGGRVLRAVLAIMMKDYTRATQTAARMGQGMSFLFGFLGLIGNPMLLFVALFVYLAAAQEASFAQMRDIVRGLRVRDAMVSDFMVLDPHATLHDAVDVMLRTGQHEFPVADARGRVVGILTRDAVIDAYRRRRGADTLVGEAMETGIPTVSEHAPLEHGLVAMQTHASPAQVVVDPTGSVVGIITPESVGELIMLRTILGVRPSEVPAWRRARPGLGLRIA